MEFQGSNLNEKTASLMKKMQFVKAIIVADLDDDIELYRYFSDDMKFKREANEVFIRGVRGGIRILYTDFKQ